LNNYFIQSPTFRSVIGGTFNLHYKVKDSKGCQSGDSISIIVDAPDASFIADIASGCTPLTVNFTNTASGASEFRWNFGDGSPVDSVTVNPAHVFTNITGQSIEYREVELKVSSAGGCTASYKTTITVFPDIVASITPNDTVVCSGSPLTFSATPGANKYFWEYGDGVSGYGTNVSTHLYTNLSTDPLRLQVKLTTTSAYNCFNVRTIFITVMPQPVPQFQAVPSTQIFDPAGNTVTFNNNSNAGTWEWLWRFGDGTTGTTQNPIHTYNGVGEFVVTLVASNTFCSDSSVSKIYVTPRPPVALFDSLISGCTPLEIKLNNTSLNLSTPGTTIYWDFGDGNTSITMNPSYIYTSPGIYRVTLTVTGPGGTSKKSQIIEAFVTPEPFFKVSPDYVFVNDEIVRCFNLSSYADSYIWDFGDGDTSRVRDPYHKYMEEGVYDITLHAYSDNGCYKAWTLTPAVTVEPAGELRFSTVFTPNKEGPIERTDLPTGGTEIDQFFFPPVREKIINYKLQIFNRLGVLIFESRDINIPWNGYYKGRLCPQGVYVWYVEGKYANGMPFRKVGDVTLLH
jgi:PKD repeat protein